MRDEELFYLNLIPTDVRKKLYQILYVGVEAYNGVLNENPQIKNSKFFTNIKTRLLTFLIFRQFEEDQLSKEFPLKVDIDKVNNFGYTALMLSNKKIRLSLSKTSKGSKLPNDSKYRIKQSANNSKYENQIRFNLDGIGNTTEESPTYFILGFGVSGKDLRHLNLLMPDTKMKLTLANVDLLQEYNSWIVNNDEDEYVEKQITSMKQEGMRILTNER